ncbi:MAG: hypothetical protein H6822_16840 [Planctomycetaceae bacterium]|nr:hypothetical protein [Planctomycetales bacterium]MCB9923851.1 hypothetical protein [Planctomycetaceae bacterium]
MQPTSGQQLRRYLLAVLVLSSPAAGNGAELKLAPVIDLNPRHTAAAINPTVEPKTLIVAAEAIPLPIESDQTPTAARPTLVGANPTVQYAAPFDPTKVSASQQTSRDNQIKSVAPVIRVYEPIRELSVEKRNTATVTLAQPSRLPSNLPASPVTLEPIYRSVFLSTRTDRLTRRFTAKHQHDVLPDQLASRVITMLDVQAKHSSEVVTHETYDAPNPRSRPTDRQSQVAGMVRIAERNPLSNESVSDKSVDDVPAAIGGSGPRPPQRRLSAPIIELAANPVSRIASPIPDSPKQPAEVPSEPVLRLVDESLAEVASPTLEPAAESASEILKIPPTKPLIQFADVEPLLKFAQQSPATADLPVPDAEPELTKEQLADLEEIEAFDLDLKPIHSLSARTKPEAGELPKNYAAARFAREGEIAHRMGYSRAELETTISWEAPAICHRPLYFEEINLERHGYKVPLVQPAISAAHFFGRVPLLPYMMVSEGPRKCQYTLGHYRPGDYAPYSLYVPRLRLDASAAELAVIAGVIFAFP